MTSDQFNGSGRPKRRGLVMNPAWVRCHARIVGSRMFWGGIVALAGGTALMFAMPGPWAFSFLALGAVGMAGAYGRGLRGLGVGGARLDLDRREVLVARQTIALRDIEAVELHAATPWDAALGVGTLCLVGERIGSLPITSVPRPSRRGRQLRRLIAATKKASEPGRLPAQ